LKKFYPRIHKGQFTKRIAKQQCHKQLLQKIWGLAQKKEDQPHPQFAFEDEMLPPSLPQDHHHIAMDVHYKLDLPCWLGQNKNDSKLGRYALVPLVEYLSIMSVLGLSFLSERSPSRTFTWS